MFWLLSFDVILVVALLVVKLDLYRREKLAIRSHQENLKWWADAHMQQQNLKALVDARTQQWKTALSNLEKSYDITLEALGEALDLKTAATEGHSRRVTAYTVAIARKMGLPKEEINVIARGAFLHDIGKMAIPDDILLKPGKLTDDEMAIMREHCYRGYKIISRIPFSDGGCRNRVLPPRALRRTWLSPWTEGRRNTAWGKARGGSEHLGRDYF